MTEESKKTEKKTLTLSLKPDAKKSSDSEQVRQSFSHGRSKTVAVEVKRKRVHTSSDSRYQGGNGSKAQSGRLTEGELGARMRALQEALKSQNQETEDRSRTEQEEAIRRAEDERKRLEEERLRLLEAERLEKEEKTKQETFEQQQKSTSDANQTVETKKAAPQLETPPVKSANDIPRPAQKQAFRPADEDEDEESGKKRSSGKIETKKLVPTSPRREAEAPRKLNRNVISRVLSGEGEERSRSMAALKRARQKQKYAGQLQAEAVKIVREVIIPEFITVGELANRMAVRSADVVKSLMKLGMMVTINQAIDADTAELICTEFGHTPKRVSEADVETGLKGAEDQMSDLSPRAPVVTVMGHVDHGKTSLLDALRKTNVVSGEAGGITQHIGAYQVQLPMGQKITFIDTPGHAAFTEMRARGANVTDIVILVVAADDGIMEQTKEAINHAKAANVPIIVAINKIDKPAANPERVRGELLNSGIVTEEFGGDIMCVEVSAKTGLNLDKLEEAILLQAEVLELKANPNRSAEGVVIEAKVDRGRGTVATILIQRGTLKVGDIFVAGTEMGRVRALINDQGHKIDLATPAMPVEILGFNGVPTAGDEFFVVETEARAREVSEFRSRRERDVKAAASARSSMEQMMSRIAAGESRELGVVIKTDVQGSLEAISQSLGKLSNEEVSVRILHAAVGGINESDIVLARASGGVVIGFNVRANPQARDLARRDGVDIRYYSIIYDVIDDIKAAMSGLLAPTLRERYLGSAEIREVFSNSKVGKVAGCYITDGMVRRGAKVRLLRDNVVIHEGTLKTLRRFKEEVREVKESYECGMAFENYNDIRQGDVIECFEMEAVARQL